MSHDSAGSHPEPIAIIGMRARVPGADDLDQLWRNLAGGVESITHLGADDLEFAGVPEAVRSLPGYVNASPLLGDVDHFDAEFFGFSARDAALTDPQHRLFLETAWEALEDAGYDPGSYPGAIGLFGGCEMSTYLYQLSQHPEALGYVDGMQLMVTNDKDHLCTQTSYRLNLRGPSVVVQTTCSTSLTALTMACETLSSGRSDLALAGGVTVRVPQRAGYLYVAGSILSPDGHCRPFDANAQGTIVGSGVGLVVLKRLSEALADGDTVRAVIRGYGINNDGSDKVGYTAPGFKGQVAAIRRAYEMAGVSPETIGYVEAHGTGTILGDPIEVSALTEVFREHTARRGFCGIGSAKSNFGHLSCAAGVVGLIKAVLSIERAAIPPTVHYRSANPALDLGQSPFYVTTSLHPWDRNGTPRRAGVSSFGVGGTNVHVVLEEAPAPAPAAARRRPHQLLTLSARSPAALDAATRRLGAHLTARPGLDLADAARTLQVGRRAFRHRRTVVVPSTDRAAAVARLLDLDGITATEAPPTPPPVAFLFPGQGAQYPGMAQGVYTSEPEVRRVVDHCCQLLEPEIGLDLRRILFPAPSDRSGAAAELRDTALAQPALFVVEYALACLWRSWGVEPSAMIGHSIGEYVAATLSGVLQLEDALRLIAARGRLISALPPGSMLAVMAPADAIADLVTGEVCLAAVNAPGLSVLSGPTPAIEAAGRTLADRSVAARPLHTSHAFHSSMMEPMLDEFARILADVPLGAPTLPYVATLTGAWADAACREPGYWTAQIRSAVQFEPGLRTLRSAGSPAGPKAVLLEVGPGRTLSTFAAHSAQPPAAGRAVASLPAPEESAADTEMLLSGLAALWRAGVTIDWDGFDQHERGRRVSLPTYPFERRSYWIGRPNKPSTEPPAEPRDPAGWFSIPTWQSAPEPGPALHDLAGGRVLVLDEGSGVGAGVADTVRRAGGEALVVRRGVGFERADDGGYVLDPGDEQAVTRLAAAACDGAKLTGVVNCWAAAPPGASDVADSALAAFLTPLRIGIALGGLPTVRPLPILLAARGTAHVVDGDELDPPRAFGLGAAKVLPQEHAGIRVSHADVDGTPEAAAGLVAELVAGALEPEIALRRGQRYVRAYERVDLAEARPPEGLPPDPVVLITGGLGHIGLAVAETAFTRLGARLVLLARHAVPPPEQWTAASDDPAFDEQRRHVLRRLALLRAERDDIQVVAADLDDGDQVRAGVAAAVARFGRIDLVVHGAANVGPSAFGAAAQTGEAVVAAQISPKITGLVHLLDAMRDAPPARWVVHGSISSVLGGIGLAGYSGANAVLDAMSEREALRGTDITCVLWDAWDNAGEAQAAAVSPILPPEGQEAMLRVLGRALGPKVVVATQDLDARIESWVRLAKPPRATSAGGHPRPNLSTAFVEPRSDTERVLARIWAEQLGLDEVGIFDRFFDLGGHSLLAVQVAAEISDAFDIEVPSLQLFKAPTVAELSVVVDDARATGAGPAPGPGAGGAEPAPPARDDVPGAAGGTDRAAGPHRGDAQEGADGADGADEGPGAATKNNYRKFYDEVTLRLDATGMAAASFFLNYGYVSLDPADDESHVDIPEEVFNRNSVRLAHELIGTTELAAKQVLDVGCGRGGTARLLAEAFAAQVKGVDLSPEAIAFCRRTHERPGLTFEVGDAEHLPVPDASCDVVVNVESSHTYPDMRAFLAEVRRVLKPGGLFLHTDLLAVQRWMEVRVLLQALGMTIGSDREITANVLASCDEVANRRTAAFGEHSATMDNFLAVPGSAVYEQMNSGDWQYRIVRSTRR